MAEQTIQPAQEGGAGPEQTYFRYLEAGDWRMPKCRSCSRVVFYPRVACPHCGNAEFDWFAPSGLGTIHSTTVMRRGPKGGGDLNLCLIDLDEGVRMMSRIEDVDPATPRIGDRVRAVLRKVGEGETGNKLVVFTLAERKA